jgi:2-polyprenyl-3-methyl-5-hydroxy-6-metoxy-1,4-benzoquinol methylase
VPDFIDALNFHDTFENPERYEATMARIYDDARANPTLAEVLRVNFLQQDRAEAFRNFCGSGIAEHYDRLLSLLGVSKDATICDLGCGPGYLAYALSRLGYKNMVAMDPNGEWSTGTGYLQAIAPNIEVINDLSSWRNTTGRFDAMVARATMHHWQHIPMVAVDARRTLKPGAPWIVMHEFVANSPHELAACMNGHLLAVQYRTYEWPYPASVYVDLMKSVGFDLVAIGRVGALRSKFSFGSSRRRFWRQVYRAHRRGRGDIDSEVMIFGRVELRQWPKTFANFVQGRLPIPRTPRYFFQYLRGRGQFRA